MPSTRSKNFASRPCVRAMLRVVLLAAALGLPFQATKVLGQVPPGPVPTAPQATASSFQGSVASGSVSQQTINLTLDDAIQRGLQHNLGIILSGTQTSAARAQQMSQLQGLLPDVEAYAREAEMQVDLAAEGLRIPGFPTVVGPFGFTDIRATLAWSLVDVKSLRDYLASKHDFRAAQLSAQDARDMVILTVGNAYLLVVSDETRVQSVQAQVNTAKVSLDQATQSHEAGTAPLLDELRARVDYQSLQQRLIVAQNALDKDRLALARTIGLPLAQKFDVADKAPYAAFDQIDVNAAIKQAQANRKDLQALLEQTEAAKQLRKAATADRYPTLSANVDYGDIGVNVRHSHGTIDSTGTVSVPVFREFALRGEAEQAQAQLDTTQAQLGDRRAQVDADIRDALLDIAAAQKEVEVARSSVDLANEALKEAQERYVAGVSDNLAVSQAEQSVAQANEQYVGSLYRHNVAKLSLARALGMAQDYKSYLGGK